MAGYQTTFLKPCNYEIKWWAGELGGLRAKSLVDFGERIENFTVLWLFWLYLRNALILAYKPYRSLIESRLQSFHG